ncbi:MAG: metallophosphatase family protein [Chloroflexi bacterium]|nr:metallophosphatase family protein [Chloroflexota bacterium]MCL5026955.1 metallophosphatase family protein [Chloroflexota bacterium]
MDEHVIGVISDTHGLLRPEALRALNGVDLIVHAGDVGALGVLAALEQIAPVATVRGNTDRGEWAEQLPMTRVIEVGQSRLYVLHDIGNLELDPAAAGFAALITGHSHRPSCRRQGGLLYLNPGTAGPRRFDLPVSVALLHIRGSALEAEIVELPIAEEF